MTRNTQTLRRGSALMIAAMLCITMPWCAVKAAKTPTPKPSKTSAPAKLKASQLKGESCILMDADTGRVLFKKAADKRRYPASTTKIMTLLLALEYGHLDDTIEIPIDAEYIPKGSSRTPVRVREVMTFRDLLFGMMIMSGNDAANAVAVIVSGSVDDFVKLMNARAKELGMEGTRYKNAHGYHEAGHYTTARDLAVLTREAMRNDEFLQICGAREYVLPATVRREKELTIRSPNLIYKPSSKYYYKYITGVKTGNHKQAGRCFVGSAERDGVRLISVSLKGTLNGRWQDTKRMMQYGFSQYELVGFAEIYEKNPARVQIEGAEAIDPQGGMLTLDIAPGDAIADFTARALPEEREQFISGFPEKYQIVYTRELAAPVRKGETIGTLSLKRTGGEVVSGALVASRDILAEPVATPEVTEAAQEATDTPVPGGGGKGPGIYGYLWVAVGAVGAALVLAGLRAQAVRRARLRARRRRRRRDGY